MPPKPGPAIDRFMKKVRIYPLPNSCWHWIGAIGGKGYGNFMYPSKGKFVNAHRFSYEYFVAPIPQGLVIDHLCSNRSCVNPRHLEAVPELTNIRRGKIAQATHCKNGHEFTVENTYWSKRVSKTYAHRRCRTCQRLTAKRWVTSRNVRSQGTL
jgi:hypothetical protein